MFKSIDNFNLTKYNLDPIANNMAFINTVAEIAMIPTSMINIVSITPSSSFSSSSFSLRSSSLPSASITVTATATASQQKQLLSSSVMLRYRIVFPSYPTTQENSVKSQAIVSSIRSEIMSGNFQVVLQSYASYDSPLK